ncbi:Cysteine--tRNA ligase [Candidatus Arsenophonus lipoptenae]|uniref:Cysteine--tRNA ligase n=1 Tax=Candidatus Arsenophonus lipoptenae TaxID=634113 RepID=A0A0X9VMI8_9GAMM|nr:cysteine--tRNA ligase [Candidatus Arsenophonus lipoptenae]AMA64941.1 Cysteine--tRNA ligase [Candidatus Arsenophonus lipoptenae]
MLQIFNTINNKKEIFQSIKPGKIDMYVCGVTVYDLCHIGHGRTFVFFDVINRYLRYLGYDLTYVRNITDIDDKIINRALKNKEPYNSLVSRMLIKMYQDFDTLNILRPDFEPRATHHIKEMITLINQLLIRGHAYIAHNGDVMFSIKSYSNYGSLSGQKIEYLQSQTNIKFSKKKNNPLDFVLWKMSKPNEPSWASPWGDGRPGWHIECSAMNNKQLGNHFDIHGGGIDLIFPHHENEIAQSTCAHNEKYVNYWIHTGMVMVGKEKMSKSLNNFITIRDLLVHYDAETIRYFLLSGHYRSPINVTKENLRQSRKALERLYITLRNTDINNNIKYSDNIFKWRFIIAMNDDFNIPEAYSVLFDLAKEINKLKANDKLMANKFATELRQLANILGLLTQDPEEFFRRKSDVTSNIEDKIKELIKQRNDLRKIKSWSQADSVRNKLNEMGISLEDTPYGTIWRYK